MRKRGWSIAEDNDPSPNSKHARGTRPRANTDHSEDTLTAAEKQELFNSFPSHELDEDEDEDEVEMFGDDDDGDDDDDDDASGSKKRKVHDSAMNTVVEEKDDDDANVVAKEELLHQAKSRLSKWAARLFDPDRRRGLVEAPEVIPLNDEFLSSFGKREKEFDSATGRETVIEDDDLDDMDFIASASASADGGKDDDDKKAKEKGMKVRTERGSAVLALLLRIILY